MLRKETKKVFFMRRKMAKESTVQSFMYFNANFIFCCLGNCSRFERKMLGDMHRQTRTQNGRKDAKLPQKLRRQIH